MIPDTSDLILSSRSYGETPSLSASMIFSFWTDVAKERKSGEVLFYHGNIAFIHYLVSHDVDPFHAKIVSKALDLARCLEAPFDPARPPQSGRPYKLWCLSRGVPGPPPCQRPHTRRVRRRGVKVRLLRSTFSPQKQPPPPCGIVPSTRSLTPSLETENFSGISSTFGFILKNEP